MLAKISRRLRRRRAEVDRVWRAATRSQVEAGLVRREAGLTQVEASAEAVERLLELAERMRSRRAA